MQVYADSGVPYDGKRVFNNLSGHCPAEPTSLAVAAAHHTLTKLLLFLVQYVKVSVHHSVRFQCFSATKHRHMCSIIPCMCIRI